MFILIHTLTHFIILRNVNVYDECKQIKFKERKKEVIIKLNK